MTLSVMLTAAGLALAASACSEKPAPTVTETTTIQTVTSASETPSSTEVPSGTITIGEMKALSVPFGRVTDNLGYYNLGLSSKDAPSYMFKDKYIYCLSGRNGDYTLRKINIENLENSGILDIKVSGGTAALIDTGFRIDIPGETVYFDFNLHEIYRTGKVSDEQILVPYKDGYILKEGENIRILHLDEDKPFRKLDSSDYVITGFHSTGDDTYLILKNRSEAETGICSVYDVNRDTYWRKLPDNVDISDAGMVRSSGGKYMITNFAQKKTETYPGKNPGKTGSSIFDGMKQYFFDEADRKIKYYVPSRQLICVLSEAEFENGASVKGIHGSYVYVEYAGIMYFIDSAGQKEIAGETYMKKIKTDAATLRSNLELHYKIRILTGKDVSAPAADVANIEVISSDLENLTAMNKLYTALKKFNFRFFDTFKQNKKEGVCILLGSNISVTDEKSGVEGYSFTGKDAYYIALDVRSVNLPVAFCREMMHTIEHRMANSEQVFGEWNRYNPEGFVYSELTAGAAEARYVPDNESDPANVYFTDPYACASASEDRARIFAVMFMPETYKKKLSDYPNLMAKAAGIKHVLLTYYPSLSDSQALQGIK